MIHVILIISIPLLMLLALVLRDMGYKLRNKNEILRQRVNTMANLVIILVLILVIILPFLTIKYIETL